MHDIKAAFGAVLSPAPKRRRASAAASAAWTMAMSRALRLSSYPQAAFTPSPHPTPFTAAHLSCGYLAEASNSLRVDIWLRQQGGLLEARPLQRSERSAEVARRSPRDDPSPLGLGRRLRGERTARTWSACVRTAACTQGGRLRWSRIRPCQEQPAPGVGASTVLTPLEHHIKGRCFSPVDGQVVLPAHGNDRRCTPYDRDDYDYPASVEARIAERLGGSPAAARVTSPVVSPTRNPEAPI